MVSHYAALRVQVNAIRFENKPVVSDERVQKKFANAAQSMTRADRVAGDVFDN